MPLLSKQAISNYLRSDCQRRLRLDLYSATQHQLPNGQTTKQERQALNLHQIREYYPRRRIDLVLDGGPQHKGPAVTEAFENTRIRSQKLPGYSPELNAIEPLWRWFREEVTYNYCHANARLLRQNIFAKAEEFSNRPAEIRRRLKSDLSRIKHLLNI